MEAGNGNSSALLMSFLALSNRVNDLRFGSWVLVGGHTPRPHVYDYH